LKSIAHEGYTFTEQCAHELSARPTDMIIVLSEVHLNSPKVMERLRKIFSAFSEMATPPPAFILMGSFYTATPVPSASSTVKSEEFQATLSAPFSALADLIALFPSIARSSRFILVPSEKDPGFSNCLPRPGLPSLLLTRLREKVQNIEFPSNPCRFVYYSREIVVFRDNLVHTLRRNCLLKPNESENSELVEHVVRTIMDQSHLSPIQLSTRPIIWNYDHALQLYPLPSVLMLGDSVQSYEFSYEHCPAVNVGSFAADGSFVVYYPSTNKIEMSTCP
jgi:DNA polymerase epsilon subunit 2